MNIYTGFRWNGVNCVFKNGTLLPAARSQAVRNHSPDGFNWSYGGSGPAQLALAILLEELPVSLAARLYQQFKADFVCRWKEDSFLVTSHEIGAWLNYRKKKVLEIHRQMLEGIEDFGSLSEVLDVTYDERRETPG